MSATKITACPVLLTQLSCLAPAPRTVLKSFARFLVRPETQRLIGEFGVAAFGQPLFFADADKTEAQLRE